MVNSTFPAPPKDTAHSTPKNHPVQLSELGRFRAQIRAIQQQQTSGTLPQATAQTQLIQALKLAAEFAEEIGDATQANTYWQQLVRLTPQDAAAWHGLGIAQANLSDYRGAMQALSRCLQIDPSNLKAKLTLAEIQQLLAQ